MIVRRKSRRKWYHCNAHSWLQWRISLTRSVGHWVRGSHSHTSHGERLAAPAVAGGHGGGLHAARWVTEWVAVACVVRCWQPRRRDGDDTDGCGDKKKTVRDPSSVYSPPRVNAGRTDSDGGVHPEGTWYGNAQKEPDQPGPRRRAYAPPCRAGQACERARVCAPPHMRACAHVPPARSAAPTGTAWSPAWTTPRCATPGGPARR